MKLKLAVLALSLAGALSACQTTIAPSQSQKEVVTVNHELHATLQAYTWTYQPKASHKPIVLKFEGDRLGIHAGCNGMGTDVTVGNGQLKTGHVVGTMMACEPNIMQQEQFAAGLFQNRDVKIKVDTANKNQPILTVYAADGKSYQFVGAKSGQVQSSVSPQLTAYKWAYQPQGSKTPIELSFQDGRLSIYSGCNRMGTSVDIQNQTFKTGVVVSTQMACDGLMQQEQFAADLFNQKTISFNIVQGEQPILTITTQDGKNYQFKGIATPETKYQSQAEIIFLEISPETKSCVGVAPQQCLQVREIKYNEQGLKTTTGNWELFYGQIENFKHEPKVRSIVRVKRFTLPNPAADQSKYVYIHDMTVEQELIK